MTDGEENASREYNQNTMRKLIEEKEKEGNWKFVFLGANQDSYATATNFGIARANVANFNASSAGTNAVFKSAALNTSAMASSKDFTTQAFFSKEDQENIENTK